MRILSSYRSNVQPIDRRGSRGFEPATAIPETRYRIGEQLVAAGVVTPEQAEQIARAQRGSQQRFGEIAVALGFATQDAVDNVLARQFNFSIAAPGASRLDPSLITARGQRDRASELVRSLRTNLSHRLDDWHGAETPCVTMASLTSGVGRRLIASNLAIASAQAGVRTLLIDADMRNPALQSLFNTPDSSGLSTLLAGRSSFQDVQSIAAIPGLDFLPAGPIPPNPTELLGKLAITLPLLRAETGADLVLINAPPLDAAEDLYVIAAAAPAVLIVARRHFTLARPLARAMERLQLAGATIIGSVLNVA
ncbi:MAG: polysaccharide biosynthesis tyrosine autokinase [Polymorphobacter sp.]